MGVEEGNMAVQNWSVLFEARLLSADESEEAEVRLLEAMEALGVEAPVTGGGYQGMIAARFYFPGELWDAVHHAGRLFMTALEKAGVEAAPVPIVIEVLPAD